jgi:hypothetical protein
VYVILTTRKKLIKPRISTLRSSTLKLYCRWCRGGYVPRHWLQPLELYK